MKRKEWVVIGSVLLIAAAVIVVMMRVIASRGKEDPPITEHAPYDTSNALAAPTDNSAPEGAVEGMLTALREWDTGLIAQWMSEVPEGAVSDAYHGILVPTLARIEFEAGPAKITGDTAMVDVSVTAVDIGGALGDLSVDAAGYLLTCSMDNTEPDWGAFLAGYMDIMDVEGLLRVNRRSTAHLIKDAGGKWRLDAGNPENLDFYNAVTGGLPEVIETLQNVQAIL
ncbi:MAG: hypothetical protein LBU86_06820 [Oscillospiraceae bacterium]|nr:hypothetical protein [Oscillospiraceae bacterium]